MKRRKKQRKKNVTGVGFVGGFCIVSSWQLAVTFRIDEGGIQVKEGHSQA